MVIEEFEKEKEKFYILHELFINNHPSIKTDNKSFVVGKESNNKIWVWTKENIEEEKLIEVQKIIEEELSFNTLRVICKDEIYYYLQKSKDITIDSFKMGILICYELNEVEKAEGFIEKSNYGDKLPLARLCQESYHELSGQDIPMAEALTIAEAWIDDDNFYVWKLEDGKIVATAKFEQKKDIEIITQVFTLKEERGKGFCKSLIYEITKIIQSENRIPVLYTDYLNEISNHIYEKLGYKDFGYLRFLKINKE